MKDDITLRLGKQGSKLFAANSSFAGIAIYRKVAYEGCITDHNRPVELENQLPYPTYPNDQNCEHVPFHLDGARHRIILRGFLLGLLKKKLGGTE